MCLRPESHPPSRPEPSVSSLAPSEPRTAMKITAITALPISFRLPEGNTVTMGVGSTTKRDAIVVRVDTDEGITGWGESHPGRSPGAVTSLIRSTLAPMLVGMEATDAVGVWQRVHRMQLS